MEGLFLICLISCSIKIISEAFFVAFSRESISLSRADIIAIYELSVYNGTQKFPRSFHGFGNFVFPGKEEKMFTSPRYATRGVTTTVPLLLQIIL